MKMNPLLHFGIKTILIWVKNDWWILSHSVGKVCGLDILECAWCENYQLSWEMKYYQQWILYNVIETFEGRNRKEPSVYGHRNPPYLSDLAPSDYWLLYQTWKNAILKQRINLSWISFLSVLLFLNFFLLIKYNDMYFI